MLFFPRQVGKFVKKLLVLLVVLTLGLAGAAYWVSHKKGSNGGGLFTLSSVEFGSLSEKVGGNGVLRPRGNPPIILPEIPGRVVEINADFNQTVEEGQVLIRLDDRQAKQNLAQAELAVQMAKSEVGRAESLRDAAKEVVEHLNDLVKRKLKSDMDLEAARRQLQAAERGVETAELTVRRAEAALQLAELGVKLTVIVARLV
jgi:HlyD family secretion protein